MRASAVWWALLLLGTTGAHAATEDMDFIAEHLPEAAMDNRLLSGWIARGCSTSIGRRDTRQPEHIAAQSGPN